MKSFNVGVEYELEGLLGGYEYYMSRNLVPDGWSVCHDGTLRGRSAEFVTHPTPIEEVEARVGGLLAMIGDDYENSHRCSMHMHVSLDGLNTWQQYVLYILMVADEDFFYSTDPIRKQNHFCTPVLRTPGFYQGLSVLSRAPHWEDRRPTENPNGLKMSMLYGSNTKYSSVNTMPAMDGGKGTIELRHFAPMMDMADFRELVGTVGHIRNLSTQDLSSYEEMCEYLSTLHNVGSPGAVDWCTKAMTQMVDECPSMIRKSPVKSKSRLQRIELETSDSDMLMRQRELLNALRDNQVMYEPASIPNSLRTMAVDTSNGEE